MKGLSNRKDYLERAQWLFYNFQSKDKLIVRIACTNLSKIAMPFPLFVIEQLRFLIIILVSQRELEKQRQQERNRHQVTMATQHYTTTLLVKFGLLPWRRLVEIARENMARATLYHNMVLLRMCFSPWLKYTRQVGEEREKAADSLYKKILLRRTWKQWRKVNTA